LKRRLQNLTRTKHKDTSAKTDTQGASLSPMQAHQENRHTIY
jgi:hypothetical protein